MVYDWSLGVLCSYESRNMENAEWSSFYHGCTMTICKIRLMTPSFLENENWKRLHPNTCDVRSRLLCFHSIA